MIYIDADESFPQYWYEKLEEISRMANPEDTILFYFAGHGMISEENAFFLLPNTVIGEENTTGLSLARINSILKEAKCSTFSIIDACHSGVDARGNFTLGFDVELMDKSWATLAACSKNECSYPDAKREQGIFTYFIAEAIKEWDKETKITIEGIKINVARRMEEWCAEKGIHQHPTLNGSVVGIQDFAKRNDKILACEVPVAMEAKVDEMVNEEVAIVNNQAVPVLWAASNGIFMPKTANAMEMLSYNAQLR